MRKKTGNWTSAEKVKMYLEAKWPGQFLFIGAQPTNFSARLFHKPSAHEYPFPRAVRRNTLVLAHLKKNEQKVNRFIKAVSSLKTLGVGTVTIEDLVVGAVKRLTKEIGADLISLKDQYRNAIRPKFDGEAGEGGALRLFVPEPVTEEIGALIEKIRCRLAELDDWTEGEVKVEIEDWRISVTYHEQTYTAGYKRS